MSKIKSVLNQKTSISTLLIAVAVVAVLGIIIALSINSSNNKGETTSGNLVALKPGKTLSKSEAIAQTEDFINTFLIDDGRARVKEIVSEYGLYKMSVDITTEVVESYITKDGRLFFPQAFDISEIYSDFYDLEGGSSQPVAMVSNKSDRPSVELFVMSHCPYGTQMEKGILPVVETLGDKIDFEIKFTSYAMRGEVELVEQINQHCIKEEQGDKYLDYLACFLADGDHDGCVAEAKVNATALATCYNQTDQEYQIMDNFRNKIGFQGNYPSFDIYAEDNALYGVSGSPTLVINGQSIQTSRDSASLLATICSAFNEAPEECATILSNASPSAGFGYNVGAAMPIDVSCE